MGLVCEHLVPFLRLHHGDSWLSQPYVEVVLTSYIELGADDLGWSRGV